MIDWDYKEIERIEDHYNKIFPEKINLKYFTSHFEEIYKITIQDKEILPDLLDNITYYTLNGINAKHKILLHPIDEEIKLDLFKKRTIQRIKRRKALEKDLNKLYQFQVEEIKEFTINYPQWKQLIIE